MNEPPRLSLDARRAALEKAMQVRKERAAIRAQLIAEDLTFAELLLQLDDDAVGKMKVLAVLESMPGIGKVKSRKLMREIGIHESRRLRGLGNRQREELLSRFS